jgi:MarR family transcriptional regulator, temperature-dependent positive regulator of motility
MEETETPGLSLLLTQLGKRVFRRGDEEAMGLRMRHFFALGLLRTYGSLPQQALGQATFMDANNLVILLNELEADGHVIRRRDTIDRRRHIVEITTAGRKALARAERALAPHEDAVVTALTPDERAELRRLLIRALGPPEDLASCGAAELELAQAAP